MKIFFIYCTLPALLNASTQVDEIRSHLLSSLPRHTRIEISNIKLNLIPHHAVLGNIQPQPPLGLVNMEYAWFDRGRSQKAYGSAVVRGYLPIAVAKTPLRNGQRVLKEGISFLERELSAFSGTGFIHEMSFLEDKEVVGIIRMGQVITPLNLRAIALISRGQGVDVVYETAGLKMVAKMKSMDRGQMGDYIRLENPKTRKVIYGKVIGSATTTLR